MWHWRNWLVAIGLGTLFTAAAVGADKRPNILWLTAEDMSPTLGCYGDAYATTPRIDALATESLRFTHAFATSPVCSPSRACLINGVIAPSQGAHPMRSAYPLPEPMVGFPALLRKAGYFTSNNEKTDYNSAAANRIIAHSWDVNGPNAHWRLRSDAEQPFFSVFNFMTSHQSRTMVWDEAQFKSEVQSKLPPADHHDPDKAPLPPYYPDDPVVRRTVARFYDCVQVMDSQVGRLLDQLEEDGLADSTYVFFYSDHGSGMPRHKRVLLDSGMRVPLLVRAPRGMAEAPWDDGAISSRMTSFESFAATVLKLAGVEQPDWMRGRSILSVPGDDYVFGHRDRIDEAIDMARSVRGKRYLYIRNYMPHWGYNQYSAWPDAAAIQDVLYDHAASRGQSAAQRHFLKPSRDVEELYDCETDPHNLRNLANDTEHQAVLKRLRKQHREYVRESLDLGFIPELELVEIARREPPMTWAKTHREQLLAAIEAAEAVGGGDEPTLLANLGGSEAAVRYWGALGLSAAKQISERAVQALRQKLHDSSLSVRLESATALARHGRIELGLPVLLELTDHEHPTVVLHAARAIEMLGGKAASARPRIEALFKKYEDDPGDPAWFIRFTTSGFLRRVPKP